MTPPPERLRNALRDLADTTEQADLYQGSLRRSRRIARREAAIGTSAALLALALLGSGLWHLPSRDETPRVAVRSPSASPPVPAPTGSGPASQGRNDAPPRESMSSGAGKRQKPEPMVAATSTTPRSRSLADLPGKIFYQRNDSRPDVLRLTPSDASTKTVLSAAPSAVGISPDGSRIAYVRDGDLLVAGTGDVTATTKVVSGVTTAAQPPAWSPDGEQLLIDASTPAIVRVGSGTLTPLPGAVQAGRHVRWSGDGSKLVYATSTCGLQVAGSSGVTAKTVPVLGDTTPSDNPEGLAACKPTSVDVTGDRVTVPLQVTGETGADGPDTADTVVDTVTGAVVPLPVDGSVVGTAFGPGGRLLVRSVRVGKTTLSLFAADGSLLVRAPEPTALHDLDLLAYTL